MTNSYLQSRLNRLEKLIKDKVHRPADLILSRRNDGQIEDWLTGETYTPGNLKDLRQSGLIVEIADSW